MSNRRRLAKKLLKEQQALERADFAVKTPTSKKFDADEDEGGINIGLDERDLDLTRFLCPSVDDQLSRPGSSLTGYSIMEEIVMMKRPEVTDYRIGVYKKRTPWKPPTDVHPTGHYRQESLLHLRRKNDLAMDLILRKGK